MTTAEFVEAVSVQSEGKIPTFVTGSTKWLRIVAQGNFFLRRWAREKGVDWNSLYTPDYTIGTVTATDTFEIPEDVYKLSQQEGDSIRINHATGTQYTDYALVPHDELKIYDSGNYCAKVGINLIFNEPFTSSMPPFGGTITAPVYILPEEFSADADDIQIDDPDWLVFVTAADRVRHDVTRKDLRADLVAQANEAMQVMKEDNAGQISEVYRPWSPGGKTW